jgi:hypothetical protein
MDWKPPNIFPTKSLLRLLRFLPQLQIHRLTVS